MEEILMFSNRFEVLKDSMINKEEDSREEVRKDRKTILSKERLKKMEV